MKLIQFCFENFRCFADEVCFDMTATSVKEHDYSLTGTDELKLLPVAAVYGANASGKSSFFLAFDRMKDIVAGKSVSGENSAEIGHTFNTPYIFDDDIRQAPSYFEVSVLHEGYEYRYGFACDTVRILGEYLYRKKSSKNRTVEKMIFEREEDGIVFGKTDSRTRKELEYCFSMINDKKLLITDIGLRNNSTWLGIVFSFFNSIILINNLRTSKPAADFIGSILANEWLDDEIKNNYLNFIREMDPSISDIVTEKEIIDGREVNVAKTKHIVNGKKYILPFSAESDGTNKLFFVAISVVNSLYYGCPLFIDELDSRLHPLIMRKIVHMYTSKATNPNGAQLVFSSHNIINLDSSDLRRDEIWFVEKENHKSALFSLAEFRGDGMRSDMNYSKNYLSGRFGAVPFQGKE